MRTMRQAANVAAAIVAALATTAGGAVPAGAFGAGGTAPGGPLSGSIRPACNGYGMDGTATRGACDGLSVDERRAAARDHERAR